MLLASVTKTVRTGLRGYFVKLLLLSLLGTAVGYGVFLYGLQAILSATSFVSWNWVEWILDWLTGAGVSFLALWLFPTILPLIANLFQEEIAGVIEQREYGMEKRKSLPLMPELMNGVTFALWALFLNIIMLPLLVFPPLYLLAYYMVNGHLLGREFFEIVAGRHIQRRAAREVRKDYRLPTFLGGIAILLLTNIPFANLFAPFFGIALMVHLYWAIVDKDIDKQDVKPQLADDSTEQ